MQTSGATFGALNPSSAEAARHAEVEYETIRNRTLDVRKIAENVGWDIALILKIKNYLFYDKHEIEGEFRRFDPSFEIAQSWTRLSGDDPAKILPHDMDLLKHELYEMQYVDEGHPQYEAHVLSNNMCCYTDSSNAYYADLKKRGKLRMGLTATRQARKADLTRCPAQRRKAESKHIKPESLRFGF